MSKGPKASASASRSFPIEIVVAIVAVVAFGVIMLSMGSEGEHPESQAGPRITNPREAVSIATSLLAGIPQHGSALGEPTAPVTLELFTSLGCLSCREFAWWGMRHLIEKWILTGKLRIEYRSAPSSGNNFTMFQNEQIAALAAGEQNKMWNYIETFYFEEPDEGKGELPSNYAQSIAAQVPGLNLQQWNTALTGTRFTSEVIRDVRFAAEHRLRSTPAVMIGRTGSPLMPFTGNTVTLDNTIQELLGTR